MNPVEKHLFTVQPFEVDFRGKITFPLLINNMLNAAGHHADKRGFGMLQLNQVGKTWVLSRICFELTGMPNTREEVSIETWIEGVMRSFTFRNFAISVNGNYIGYARTIWAMIDTETRKPENLEDKGIAQYLYNEKECPIGKIVKINTTEEVLVPTDKFTVRYSDLDINQHLNSAKYVEHIFDAFDIEEIGKHNVKKFEIEFIEECRFGEEITIYRGETAPQQHTILLKNGREETVCKCRLTFE